MDLLDPKNDLVFKMLLTRCEDLLLNMLSGILGRPIRDLDVTNPTIPGDLSGDKRIVLDIRALLADGAHVDLEMQNYLSPELAERLLFYATRGYGQQLRRGDQYHLLAPTAAIAWLTKPLIPEIPHLHSVFELRDRATGTRLSDHLTVHLLQLSNLDSCPPPPTTTDYTATVHRWARFLTARTTADFERLAAEHPIMSLAKQNLEQLSMDPAAYELAQEREDAIKLYNFSLYASKREGRAEGVRDGQAKVLLKQLGLRFGAIPEKIQGRVDSATPELLDRWTERILTSITLDEVFAP